MYRMLLPRIFTNICQLRDVYAERSDYSLRANTFAPPGAIPRVAYVAVRTKEAGRNVLYMWALWIQVIPHPPSHQVAFQYDEDGKHSYNRILLHLCYTIPSNNCHSYCSAECPIHSIPTSPSTPNYGAFWYGAFWTWRWTRRTSSAIMYGSTCRYIAPNYILEHQNNP